MTMGQQIRLQEEIYEFQRWINDIQIECKLIYPEKVPDITVTVPNFQRLQLKDINLHKHQLFSLKPTLYDSNIKFIFLHPLFTISPTGFVKDDEDINIFAPTKAQTNFYMYLGSILHEVFQEAISTNGYDLKTMLIQQLQEKYYQFFQYMQYLEEPDNISKLYQNLTIDTITSQLIRSLDLLKQKINTKNGNDIRLEKHINSQYFRLQGKIDIYIQYNNNKIDVLELKTRVSQQSYRQHATQLMCYIFSLIVENKIPSYYDLVGLINNHSNTDFDLSLFKRLQHLTGQDIFKNTLGKDIFHLIINQRNATVQYWYNYDKLDFVVQLQSNFHVPKLQRYFKRQKTSYLKQWMKQFDFEHDLYNNNLDKYDKLMIRDQIVDITNLQNKYQYQLSTGYVNGQYRIAVYNTITQEMTYTWLFCQIDNGYITIAQELKNWKDYILIIQTRVLCPEFQLYNLVCLKNTYQFIKVNNSDIIQLIKEKYESSFIIKNKLLVVNKTISSFSSFNIFIEDTKQLYDQLQDYYNNYIKQIQKKKIIFCTYTEFSELYNNLILNLIDQHDEDYDHSPVLSQTTYNPIKIDQNTNIILIDPEVDDNKQECWISALGHHTLFIFTDDNVQSQFMTFWSENISDVSAN